MKFKLFIIILIFSHLSGCGLQHKRTPVKTEIEHSLPHIIVITIDTLRADHLGCYKYHDIRTPHIDSLAEEGVLFEHAYTSTPITLPAHASIMTGLYPQAHGLHNNATYYLNPSATTLAEVLNQTGYRTAAFVGAYVLHSRYGLNQGFQLYNDHLPQGEQGIKSLHNLYDERSAEETTALALEWLSENKDAPCFVWIHYFEPHAPYIPPLLFRQGYINQPYDGEIAYTDQCVGQLVRGVQDMELYNHTAFILTSDHGEGLGEHDEMTHGVFLYDSTLHIPLIMRFPGINPTSISEVCRNIDIFPTILHYCGIQSPGNIQGISLLPLMVGKEKDLGLELIMESRYASENFGWSPLAGIRTREWKYIKAPTPELYDLITDTKEIRNLWGDHGEKGEQLQQRWQDLCAQVQKQKQFDSATTALTPQVREQMKSLGYVWFASEGEEREIDPKEMAPLLDKLDKGVIYYTMGKYDEAIRELKKLIDLNPKNSMGHFHLGCAYFLKGDLNQAKDHFIKVTELDPRHIDAYNYLGYIYAEENDLTKAEETFKYVLKLNPSFSEGHYNLGILFYRQGDFQKSLEEFRMATKLNPHHLEGLYNLGSLYFDLNQFKEAEEILQRALALNPDHPQTRNSLGKLYNKQKEYEKAEEHFLAAIRADGLYKEAFNNLASVYITRGQYNEALKNLETAVSIDQNFGDAYYNLGVAYRALGDFVKALEYLRRTSDTGFYGYELCYATGDTFLRLQQYEDARKWLRQAVSLNPDSWKGHFDLAVALSAGDYNLNEAIGEYKRAIALDPGAAAPYINLGIIYFQKNELPLATQLWQQALEVEPDNIEAQINIGGAYVQMGLYERAVERYKQSLLLHPENLTLYYNLAIAYLHQKNNKEAIICLHRALKIDPDFDAGKKLLDLAQNWGGE